MKSPTLREIAAVCGVNHSTVSRALAGSPLVAAETRKSILETAQKLGWKPNPLASAYVAHVRSCRATSYQATLGLILDRPKRPGETKLPKRIHQQMAAARAQAESYGFKLEAFHLQGMGLTSAQLHRMLISRNISGLILHGFRMESKFSGFNWEDFTIVERRNFPGDPQFHRVSVNTYRGFYLMICKAFALGYNRLGVIVSRQYDRLVDHGVLFPVAFARDHIRPTQSIETLILSSHSQAEKPVIQAWLRKMRPEIVIGVDLAWDAIQEMGWKVPEDMAFIMVDSDENFPHIAGFNQRLEVQLTVAIDLLVSQVTLNRRGIPTEPIVQVIDGVWQDGASAPNRRRHRKTLLEDI